MEWHLFPKMPKANDHIIAKMKGRKGESFLEFYVREEDSLGQIEKWAKYEDFQKNNKKI